MAGPPFEAGSILIALRASAETLQKEVQKANATLQQFGKQVQDVAVKTNQTSESVAKGFGEIDRKTLQVTGKIANFTQRLLGLQFVLQSFSNATAGAGDGMDKFKDKTQGLTSGLTVFAGIVSIFPNKIGLIVGAIAGLTVFIADLVRQFTKAGEEVEKFEKQLEELDKGRAQRQREREVEAIRLQQLRLAGIKEVGQSEALINGNLDEQKRVIQDLVDAEDKRVKASEARNALEKRLQEELKKTNELRAQTIETEFGTQGGLPALGFAEFTEGKASKELEKLTVAANTAGAETAVLRKRLQELNKEAAELREKARLEETFTDAIKVMSKFGEESVRLRVRLEQGLITPAEAAAGQLANARAELEAFTNLGANAQNRISIIIDTKKGETAFDALVRRVKELQGEAKAVEIQIANEAEIKRLVEGFQSIRKELKDSERLAQVVFVEPLQQAQGRLEAAERQLREFVSLTREQQVQVGFKVFGTENALDLLVQQVNQAKQEVGEIELRIKGEKALQDLNAILEGVSQGIDATSKAFDIGLVDSTQAVNEQISALESALRRLIEFQGKLSPFDQAALDASEATINSIKTTLEKFKSAKVTIEAEKQSVEAFERTFAAPFSQAVGDAITTGILQGQDAMEIVANAGESLFRNFLNNVVNDFQKGMVKAFDAIAGAGGEALGGLLGAAAGIAGFFLSQKEQGESQKSFAPVQGEVESTQAVRGIVAGPESVAIAAVGENLRRAMVGVEARLDALIRVAVQIRDGQGVGGTASGTPFAGTVPTS